MYTRTINPIHFEDLEPHRFEDLVRQLAYDFKTWKTIEALGRSGSDDGIDIRAIEIIQGMSDEPDLEDGMEISIEKHERGWVIQCKREKSIGPTRVKKIVSESFSAGRQQAYGFVLAAACDFSKKTREVFREALNEIGIQEYYIWGKAELEDMLFMPRYDHLLFAYFGLSLQVRRKSLRTTLRSRLAMKRKVISVLEGNNSLQNHDIMIRDAFAEEYPVINNLAKFKQRPQWGYFEYVGQQYPYHLTFKISQYWAYVDVKTNEWDALFGDDLDLANLSQQIHGMEDKKQNNNGRTKVYELWKAIPEDKRGFLVEYGFISIDRILAIDEHGDTFHQGPHILIDMTSINRFFDWDSGVLEVGSTYSKYEIDVDEHKRIKYFPNDD